MYEKTNSVIPNVPITYKIIYQTKISECKGRIFLPSHQIRSTNPRFFSTNSSDFRNI